MGKPNFSFLNLISIQKLIINQGKESNYNSHLVYYFILGHMHLRDHEILTKGYLTLTLMPCLFLFLVVLFLNSISF